VISELISNAISHALPPAVLRLSVPEIDGRRVLRIEVTDGGPQPRSGRQPAGPCPEEHGRGISIVIALSVRCGTRSHPDGITRWADLRLR
jgi:anti-sigma regulatory factor (Ser/Thr protein kinase)